MTKKIYSSLLLFLFLSYWCFGYIDPGTGSYVIQVILAVFVGASIGIKVFWSKIKTFFGKLFSKKNKEEN